MTITEGAALSRTEYDYDILGNKSWTKMPMAFVSGSNVLEHTTFYEYDELLRLEKVETVYKGATVNTIYGYDALGNKTFVKDAKDNITEYTFDEMNRLNKVIYAKDTDVTYEVSYQYDLTGNKTAEVRPSGTWRFEYDLLNRLSVSRDPYNDVTSKNIYDANGNIEKIIDGRGYLSASNDEARYGTVYNYNKANLVETVTDAEGVSVENEYNAFGEKASVTDGLNNTTVYAYNNAGNLASVTDPLGNETQYSYDKAGNRTSITDANENVTCYAYSSFGMLLSITDPAARVQTYKYNLSGKPTKMNDRKGNTTSYSYNSLDLLTNMSVVEMDETQVSDTIGYDYDCLGNRVEMTDSTGTYSYTYNELSRLTSVSKDSAVQISYTYTDDGNIETTSYGDVTTIYTYYDNGRLLTVRNGGQGADYYYDASGNIDEIQYVGGATEEFTYYNNNAAHTVTNKNSGGAVISSYSYTYDNAGRQDSKTDSLGAITTYEYDACGRLESVTMPGKTSVYGYDNVGNRLSLVETYSDPKSFDGDVSIQYIKKEESYDYNDGNELVKKTESMYNGLEEFVSGKETSYIYDPNGNQNSVTVGVLKPSIGIEQEGVSLGVLSEDSTSIEPQVEATTNSFDVWNRLVKRTVVKDGKQSITEFTYNGDGLRMSKTEKASDGGYTPHVTNYLYDGQHVVREDNGSSATAVYIRGLNYIAKIGVTSGVDYYMYNAHGDVVQVTSGNGTVKNRYEYDAFGETILEIEETENTIKYAGEFQDSSTGLYYLRARYYDAAIGRFISEDTYRGEAFNPASLNLYTYCMNDPIQLIDPSGHAPDYGDDTDAIAYVAKQNGVDMTVAASMYNYDKKNGTNYYGTQTYTPGGGSYAGGSYYYSGAKPSTAGSMSASASTVSNFNSLSSDNQRDVNSSYIAWQGGYFTFDQYAEAVKKAGGTLADIDPTVSKNPGAPFSATSANVSSSVNVAGAGNSPVVITGSSDVTVAGQTISGIHNINGANYAALREMVYALEFGLNLNDGTAADLQLPLTAQRVVWDATTRTATVRVTNRETGELVTTTYNLDQASEANGFLVVDGQIVVGVRSLARTAGIEKYLEWHNGDSGRQSVNLYDQKRILYSDGTTTTTYTGFTANDNAYLSRGDAEALLGAGISLTEHARIPGYFNVSAGLTNRYGNSADFIMANFHKTNAMQNGTTTVIAEVPAAQSNHPAQIIRVGQYGLIRVFADMEWRTLTNNGVVTTVPQADRQGMQDMVTAGIEAMGGTWANVWGDGKDFHVNSQVVWSGSGNGAIRLNQVFHRYEVTPGTGRASASMGGLVLDANRNVTGANWSDGVSHTANLFAGSDFNNSTVITHETFHMLGLEDAYEYTLARDNMIKPRASLNLVPDNAMMHWNVTITNLEMRMLFDAKANGTWTQFANYQNQFVIISEADYAAMIDPNTRTAAQINQASQGNTLTTDGRIVVSYKKSGQYLRSGERP